jgi:Leucine-rich repeat (LRR) protein
VLDLHDNQLSGLPDRLAELVNLTKLNLGHNRLAALPEAVFSLRSLRVLQASNNLLETVGEGLGALVMLQTLDLANNKIKVEHRQAGYTKNNIFSRCPATLASCRWCPASTFPTTNWPTCRLSSGA